MHPVPAVFRHGETGGSTCFVLTQWNSTVNGGGMSGLNDLPTNNYPIVLGDEEYLAHSAETLEFIEGALPDIHRRQGLQIARLELLANDRYLGFHLRTVAFDIPDQHVDPFKSHAFG